MRRIAYCSLIVPLVLCPSLALAQWQVNGSVVCGEASSQLQPAITTDGAGGAIIVWADARDTASSFDIYAQRISASGVTMWAEDGVLISGAADSQSLPMIVSDGFGGAIIAWEDERFVWHRIFAQRVNASGIVQWTPDGVAICSFVSNQFWPRLASDGAGGAIISWLDLRPSTLDIYAQHVDGAGSLQWAAAGVPVCSAANNQTAQELIPDGSGGAILVWMDERSSPGNDIYVQHIDALGASQWTPNGVALCTFPSNEQLPQLVADGSGGAIVAWYSLSTQVDVYANRIDAAGVVQWTANGVVVCNAPNNQDAARIVPDGAGGGIVMWQDYRSGTAYDIYAQRLNGAGVLQWPVDGVPVTTATNHQTDHRLVSDGAGGAIVAWDNARPNDHDIYAQRVDASGTPQWTTNGVPISETTNEQQTLPVITTDGDGGAIIAWQHYHYFAGDTDIYALRYPIPPTPVGRTPTPVSLHVLPNYPNPFSSSTRVDVYLPADGGIAVDIHDAAGRLVRRVSSANEGAGWRQVQIDARDDSGRVLPNGVYFYRVRVAGEVATGKMVIAR